MEDCNMKNSALVVIDLQNDITKNHKEIIAYANTLDRVCRVCRVKKQSNLKNKNLFFSDIL